MLRLVLLPINAWNFLKLLKHQAMLLHALALCAITVDVTVEKLDGSVFFKSSFPLDGSVFYLSSLPLKQQGGPAKNIFISLRSLTCSLKCTNRKQYVLESIFVHCIHTEQSTFRMTKSVVGTGYKIPARHRKNMATTIM